MLTSGLSLMIDPAPIVSVKPAGMVRLLVRWTRQFAGRRVDRWIRRPSNKPVFGITPIRVHDETNQSVGNSCCGNVGARNHQLVIINEIDPVGHIGGNWPAV